NKTRLITQQHSLVVKRAVALQRNHISKEQTRINMADTEIKNLIVRMKQEFGYEQLTVLKKEYDALSPKDKEELVLYFNEQGLPTKL
ncbi:MAG: hypothetical protein ACREBJ_08180, partial [Nitrosotalea sp.]